MFVRSTVTILSVAMLCAAPALRANETDHVAHPKTAHVHGEKDCKHTKVKHGDHTDFLHDSEYHAAHEDHFDNHGHPAKADTRKTDSTDALKIAEHDHKHDAKCGHKAVKHGDHTDYEHDGHFHASHGDHVDDHGQAPGHQHASN